ncbi:MAG TPA: hypothetical protein EYQ20_06415, partial [candidate division Zixibacteria bacterium]|nr:hypothetical protein [candidate division Zixibacteria bacterium]
MHTINVRVLVKDRCLVGSPIAAAVRRLQSENELAVSMVLPSDDLSALAKSIAPDVVKWKLQVGDLTEALKTADAAIASSGTVTMECA